MKKTIFIGFAILSLLALSACTSQNNVLNTPPLVIEITDTEFIPAKITIKKGQQVDFVNKSTAERWPASNIHPTHDIYPEFDPQKALAPGETWSFVFNKEGIWRSHDHINPEIKGVITVEN